MPHECTTCGRTFPDGSKEMLSGCPDCGGNKFQFHPGGTSAPGTGSDASTGTGTSDGVAAPGSGPETRTDPESESTPASNPTTPPSTSTDSSFTFGSPRSEQADSSPDPVVSDGTEDDSEPMEADSATPREDRAQASARSTFVSDDELLWQNSDEDSSPEPFDSDSPIEGRGGGAEPPTAESPTGDDPHRDGRREDSEPADISELREELNDQFESIKIHARGEYELNLMELYDREEHIIALEEDGRYVIDVPSSWRETDEDDS
jgi:predicted  nucleic acid-binding Zn-ribbon protein